MVFKILKLSTSELFFMLGILRIINIILQIMLELTFEDKKKAFQNWKAF
ncbi:hypothetical protein CA2559_12293 [Croceibacter atlanticus HTCC2559]|uniref:Uncharacterized protein n=1 Tax=Croceibacter atlanticus (strain ATCC BAA-628 / JCM 21780 / CIP 108009 / IAM 15332 / KCTC 12090 / HTCC2559) TaxID=216432 RepID=A3UAI1_CROAH|nr:hypothetical protein CA2559_12293 [Croceibacter atlanticus HTCC2559]